MKKKIAIIGAGISGITLAKNLSENFEVKIFEKSRGLGGRMSSRYHEKFSFDHGVHSFTARGREFQNFLAQFIENGDIAAWTGKAINIEDKKISPRFWFETHLVALPNMNSLCKKMAQNLDISTLVEVSAIKKINNFWNLHDKNGEDLGVFDFVISTAPPAQTKKIFCDYFYIPEVAMQPCFSMMVGFEEKWKNDWIFAKVKNNPIKLIAVNSSKPGRNNSVTSLVVQTRKNWSTQNLNLNVEEVQKVLLKNLSELIEINCSNASYVSVHRWLYALIDSKKEEMFFDAQNNLAAFGDWSCDSRIEDVWIAAKQMAVKIKKFYGEI